MVGKLVPVDDVEDVHELAFVLVDAFYLDVEEGFDVDLHAVAVHLYPFGEGALVLELHSAPAMLEVALFGEVLKLFELVEIEDPLVAVDFVSVEVGE